MVSELNKEKKNPICVESFNSIFFFVSFFVFFSTFIVIQYYITDRQKTWKAERRDLKKNWRKNKKEIRHIVVIHSSINEIDVNMGNFSEWKKG